MIMKLYSQSFYEHLDRRSTESAREIAPLVIDLVQPESVVDVGCGVGSWLSVFKELGVAEIFGVDGRWVDKERLKIPKDHFLAHDLGKPLDLDRRFDLVVSLEVAEHLPEDKAEVFIETLTSLGPVILFSAAIPFQRGRHHLNEQWPDYWAGIFRKHDYQPIDCIRKKIWQNDQVPWWYAQNILVYAKNEAIAHNPRLAQEQRCTSPDQLSLVHPRKYLETVKTRSIFFSKASMLLRILVKKEVYKA